MLLACRLRVCESLCRLGCTHIFLPLPLFHFYIFISPLAGAGTEAEAGWPGVCFCIGIHMNRSVRMSFFFFYFFFVSLWSFGLERIVLSYRQVLMRILAPELTDDFCLYICAHMHCNKSRSERQTHENKSAPPTLDPTAHHANAYIVRFGSLCWTHKIKQTIACCCWCVCM